MMKTYQEMCKIIDDGGSVFVGGEVVKDKALLKDAMETEKTFAPSLGRAYGVSTPADPPPPAPADTATAELIEMQKARIAELERILSVGYKENEELRASLADAKTKAAIPTPPVADTATNPATLAKAEPKKTEGEKTEEGKKDGGEAK